MAYAASGSKVTSSLINGIFPAILSQFTQRQAQSVGGTITATTFGLPGTPCSVTMTSSGTFAAVFIGALIAPAAAGNVCRGSIAVSGATTITAATNLGLQFLIENGNVQPIYSSAMSLIPITPGTNTFTLQYLVNAGSAVVGSQSITVIAP